MGVNDGKVLRGDALTSLVFWLQVASAHENRRANDATFHVTQIICNAALARAGAQTSASARGLLQIKKVSDDFINLIISQHRVWHLALFAKVPVRGAQ